MNPERDNNVVKCAECGQLLPDGARFCTSCGRRIAGAAEPPQIEPSAAARNRLARQSEPVVESERMRPLGKGWGAVPVVVGVILGVAIYGSISRDDALARREAAQRIEASIGARPTASQEARPGTVQFSARQALQALYGNYDPNLDGAFWVVAGAPKQWASWNGRPVLVRPLISRSDDNAATRHVLVTNTLDVKDGMLVKQGTGCRTCKSLLGAALFERQGSEWKLVADYRFVAADGAFGGPPLVSAAFPAHGGVELRIEAPAPGTEVAKAVYTITLNAPRSSPLPK